MRVNYLGFYLFGTITLIFVLLFIIAFIGFWLN